MFGYVYKLSHAATGYYYIGCHVSSVVDHQYRGSGAELKRLYKKYHRSEWELSVLEEVETFEQLNAAEIKWIGDLYKTDPLCVNRREGGARSAGHSEETKEKLRKIYNEKRSTRVCKFHNNFSQKGLGHLSDIHRGELNPMFGKTGSLNPSSKKVMCMETGIVYDSAHDATRATGIQYQNICKVCLGKRSHAGGYTWVYCDKEDNDYCEQPELF